MEIAADFRRTFLQYERVFLDSALITYHLEDIKPYSMLTEVAVIMLSKFVNH